jgi:hypothetical protein
MAAPEDLRKVRRFIAIADVVGVSSGLPGVEELTRVSGDRKPPGFGFVQQIDC